VYKEDRTQNYDAGKTFHYIILPVTSFSINFNKTHKSPLNAIVYKIAQKIKNQK